MEKLESEIETFRTYSNEHILEELKKRMTSKGSFWFRPHASEFFFFVGSLFVTLLLIAVGLTASWSTLTFILVLAIPVILLILSIAQIIHSFFLFKHFYELYKNEALRRNLI